MIKHTDTPLKAPRILFIFQFPCFKFYSLSRNYTQFYSCSNSISSVPMLTIITTLLNLFLSFHISFWVALIHKLHHLLCLLMNSCLQSKRSLQTVCINGDFTTRKPSSPCTVSFIRHICEITANFHPSIQMLILKTGQHIFSFPCYVYPILVYTFSRV